MSRSRNGRQALEKFQEVSNKTLIKNVRWQQNAQCQNLNNNRTELMEGERNDG